MNKKICDICETNEASEMFKIKQLRTYINFDLERIKCWDRIDICTSCYEQIKNNSRKKNKEK